MRTSFVLLVVVAACRSKAPPTPAPQPSASSSSPSLQATRDAAPAASATSRYARPPGCPDYVAALASARKLTLDKDWVSAIDAFDDAVRARPLDAHVRAERGYAQLLSGNASAAKSDLLQAILLTKDKALLAQIYFNLGDVFDKLGDAEASRVAFSVAERQGSAAAKGKLGGRSHCPATWRIGTATRDPSLEKGWLEVAKLRSDRCSAARDTKLSPRDRACRGCANASEDRCTGAGPWLIDDDYSLGRPQTLVVVPLGSDTFLCQSQVGETSVLDVHVDGGFARWTEKTSTDSVLGEWHGTSVTATDSDAFVAGDGRWSDAPDGSTCKPDLKSEITTWAFDRSAGEPNMQGAPMLGDLNFDVTRWFDIASRKQVFLLTVYAGKVTATVRAHVAHVSGEGCDGDVALP